RGDFCEDPIDRQILYLWGSEDNKMSGKNKKLQRLGLVLVIAGLLAGSLLRANDEGPGTEAAKPAPKKSQEQVLKDLLKQGTPGPMISPDISGEVTVPVVEPVDPKAKRPLLLRDGDLVSNRLGRLAKDAKGTLLFVYEADGAHLSEPPLILLPCLKLEQMELLVAKQPNAKFTITGEVTVYHGKGYLLLRKVMLHRDLGQF
ncbi:unnamed protein product, partial [marine sediment metagenome]